MTARLVVPPELVASHRRYGGEAGQAWVDGLAALAEDRLAAWELRPDGPPRAGAVALVLPVRRADGAAAALKLQPVDDETVGEAEALRLWSGLGAVGLLEHDPRSGAMLLDRLDAERSLAGVPDDLEALTVLTHLMRGLHTVRAPAGLRRLDEIAAVMLERLPSLLPLVGEAAEQVLLQRIGDRLGELLADRVADRLLHWDLHYDNVLASLAPRDDRPWRVIDPKPLAGDPGFDLLPALFNRWPDVLATRDVAGAVRRRFDLMVDVLGLERERATTWNLARVLQNTSWELASGRATRLAPSHRVIAEALLGR